MCRTAKDFVENSQYTEVFARQSEVTDGRNCLEYSLYRTFLTSMQSRIQKEDSSSRRRFAADEPRSDTKCWGEGRQAEQSVGFM
jgi:hypothetical protein